MNSPPLTLPDQPTGQPGREEGSKQDGFVSGQQLRSQSPWKAAGSQGTAADGPSSGAVSGPPLQTFEELEIPDAFRAAVEKELTADEKILWLGRPSRNPQVNPRNTWLPMTGMALMLLGIGTIAVSLMAGLHDIFPFVLATGLMVIGGAFLLSLLVDPTKVCRACYVVTNRRAMLLENSVWARGPSARSYLPPQLLGLERRNHPEVAGAGDLIFEYFFALPGNSIDPQTGTQLQGLRIGRSDTPQRVPRGFFLLDQVDEVESLIRTALLGQLEKSLDGAEQAPAASVAPRSPSQSVPSSGPMRCPDISTIAPALKAKALADLDPSEKVEWIGQPVGAIVLVRSSAWLAGGAVGILIALLWLLAALRPARPVPVPVQKAPAGKQTKQGAPAPQKAAASSLLNPCIFLLVSACCAAVPFVRRYFAGRTCYVLTNRRALVYREGLFGPSRDSYPPIEVARMRLSPSFVFRGSGDLIFRSVTVVKSLRGGGLFNQSVKTTNYGFLAIAQVQEVEKIVRETLIDPVVDRLTVACAL